jgi:ATP-dependent Clp protease ATP-binding subunit ClpA
MNRPHPLIIALTVLSLGVTLSTVGQTRPGALPWILGFALAGMAARALMLASDGPSPFDGKTDHAALREIDFKRYREALKERVRGHDKVVDTVVDTLQRGFQLSQPGRSLGSFLLVGPTGTGKTFLSTMSASFLWPDREPLVLNMNQYKSPSDVSALMGWSGADGQGAEGALTGAIAAIPHRVVLLDEIDKCHPEVLHGLLEILDGGRCRDKATGKLVDFSGCVFFATCNAGVESLRQLVGVEPQSYVAKARDVLAREAGFDKSFLARFSEILLMDTLAPVHIAEIACLLIAEQWREQGVEVRYIAPEILAAAVKANEEFGQYGVRQLALSVRRMTDGLLDAARRRGLRQASLGTDASGAAALIEAKAARTTTAS